MTSIPFPEQNITFAKDQPEYNPLPAHISESRNVVVSCWKLSPEEWEILKETRCVYLSQCIFGQPLQPIAMDVTFNPPQL